MREARIQSISRAVALLDAMTSGEWIRLRDLALKAGLAKTTAFNLVGALVDVGLVEHQPATGAYRLSVQHLLYGKSVERRLDIAERARPCLVRLCAETRETVNLALPRPTDTIIVESLESSQNLRVSSYAGTRADYHSTACGRALLAWQSDQFRRTILELRPLQPTTPRTITDPEKLETMLEHCRTVGWTSEFEENEIGGACVAAPIFDSAGKVVASVSIAGPSARFTQDAMRRHGALLVKRLTEVSALLQGHAPARSNSPMDKGMVK